MFELKSYEFKCTFCYIYHVTSYHTSFFHTLHRSLLFQLDHDQSLCVLYVDCLPNIIRKSYFYMSFGRNLVKESIHSGFIFKITIKLNEKNNNGFNLHEFNNWRNVTYIFWFNNKSTEKTALIFTMPRLTFSSRTSCST